MLKDNVFHIHVYDYKESNEATKFFDELGIKTEFLLAGRYYRTLSEEAGVKLPIVEVTSVNENNDLVHDFFSFKDGKDAILKHILKGDK